MRPDTSLPLNGRGRAVPLNGIWCTSSHEKSQSRYCRSFDVRPFPARGASVNQKYTRRIVRAACSIATESKRGKPAALEQPPKAPFGPGHHVLCGSHGSHRGHRTEQGGCAVNTLKTIRGESHACSIVALQMRLESLAGVIDVLRAQDTSRDRRISDILHAQEKTRFIVDVARKHELQSVEQRAKSVLLLLSHLLDPVEVTGRGETDALERAFQRLAGSVAAISQKADTDASTAFASAREHFLTSLPNRLKSIAANLDILQASRPGSHLSQVEQDLARHTQAIVADAEVLDLGCIARRARSMLVFIGNTPNRQHVLQIEKLPILTRAFDRLIRAIEKESGNMGRCDQ